MGLMKKGLMFTMVSLLVSGFFLVLFSADTSPPLDEGVDTVRFRVDVIHRFSQSWEDFVQDSLRSASYRALERMALFLHDPGSPQFSSRAEFENNFRECLMNGTLFNSNYNCSEGGSEINNKTLNYFLSELSSVADDNMSLDLNYSINKITIGQQFPFLVRVEANISYEIQDSFATIRRDKLITSQVSVEGLTDPLQARHLPSTLIRDVRETDTKPSEWDKSNLTEFVQGKEYRYHQDAPSFLMRFNTGEQFGSSLCCGIESVLANNGTLDVTGDGRNASFVDFKYIEVKFGSASPPECGNDTFVITSPLDNVQMDAEHLANFNVSTSEWQAGCPAG